MECIALGTGGMMPMPLRLTTSMLVRRDGRMLMFDAGEGIQLALKKGGLGIRALDAVAISHLHADHVLGLPGILMFRAQNEQPHPLTIIGPPGIARFVRHTLEDLKYHVNFNLEFIEWQGEQSSLAWEWHGVRLTWAPLNHSTFCLGYRLEEPQRPGRFNLEKADELGIPKGPLFGRLQNDQTVTLPDGRTITPEQVLGKPRRGRVIAFVTDTRPCPAIHQLVQGTDLAFIEGMFTKEHQTDAAEKGHMTAAQAAEIAAASAVKRLVLVHISPRYAKKDEATLEAQAKEHFDNVEVATALKSYPIPLPE